MLARVFRTPVRRMAARLATTLIIVGLAVPASAGESAFIRTAASPELEWGPCPAFMPAGCSIAVLHGNPAEPSADVFFRLSPGATVPLHWHSSAERMVLVAGELEVAYAGQEPVVMKTGTYGYGPTRLEHSATCVSGEPCVLFIAFVDPVDAFPGEP